MNVTDGNTQTNSIVEVIRERKRCYEATLTEIVWPACTLLSQIDAKRARIDKKRMDIERLEKEAADLDAEYDAMLNKAVSRSGAAAGDVDLHDQFERLLARCDKEGESCIYVPIGWGYAVEPWLAALAGESDRPRAAHDGDSALASRALETLTRRQCTVARVTIVVALETPTVDMTNYYDDPDLCFDRIKAEHLPAFEVESVEVRDADDNDLPLARMIDDDDDDDRRLKERAIRMAQHSSDTMEGDRRGLSFRDEVEIGAWAVCMPRIQRE